MSPDRRRRARRHSWPDRARTLWRGVARELFYPLGMLDEKGNPSATRMLAVWLAWVGGHGRIFHDDHLTVWDVTLLMFAAFAALGKSGLEMYDKWKGNEQGVNADLARRAVDAAPASPGIVSEVKTFIESAAK